MYQLLLIFIFKWNHTKNWKINKLINIQDISSYHNINIQVLATRTMYVASAERNFQLLGGLKRGSGQK